MSSVISVNVGLPREVEWQDKTVYTAVWKSSVSTPVMARRLNLDGDGQGDLAGHGGEHRALMVYQIESYHYWEAFLKRSDFEYGQFGENLTVQGLPDNEVCIGDRYRIGGALFEVTQPRVTCYRVGMRMNNPQMPSLLVSHKRPGFYCRVLEEGEIGAGYAIVKVADGPERMSVSEVDGLLYLPGHSRGPLQRALRIPALSSGWKTSFEALLRTGSEERSGNAGLVPSAPPPAWAGFRELQVAEVRRECADVLSFIFESTDGSSLPAPLPGQFVVVKLSVDTNPVPLIHSYSLSGPQTGGKYRISVKRATGAGSRYLHEHVLPGNVIEVSAPRGSFTLAPGENPVVLLSAGIGVTPVLAMLHSLASSEPEQSRQVWWCYGARNAEEHPFAAEVRELLKRLPNARSFVMYSRPLDADKDHDAVGHLNLSALKTLGVPQLADFYLCGPATFLADFQRDLRAWGVPNSRIHSEGFGAEQSFTPGIASKVSAPPHPPTGEVGAGPNISFTRSRLVAPWNSRYSNLLEFAEACDVPVRWSCRSGVCHTCETGLIDGQVQYSPEPIDRPGAGNVLICCSSPLTAMELDL